MEKSVCPQLILGQTLYTFFTGAHVSFPLEACPAHPQASYLLLNSDVFLLSSFLTVACSVLCSASLSLLLFATFFLRMVLALRWDPVSASSGPWANDLNSLCLGFLDDKSQNDARSFHMELGVEIKFNSASNVRGTAWCSSVKRKVHSRC